MMCMPSLLHRSASHYVVYERADCFRQAVNSDSRAGDSDSASRSIQNWSCLVYLYCVSTFSIERTLAKHTYFHRLSASRKLVSARKVEYRTFKSYLSVCLCVCCICVFVCLDHASKCWTLISKG
uniref:Uncharacterized protein n=1 Tax=Hyaloperonospora arabidopsidis (strain Emoy2) TaxID=559515 RepID=M4BU66_HYAAE